MKKEINPMYPAEISVETEINSDIEEIEIAPGDEIDDEYLRSLEKKDRRKKKAAAIIVLLGLLIIAAYVVYYVITGFENSVENFHNGDDLKSSYEYFYTHIEDDDSFEYFKKIVCTPTVIKKSDAYGNIQEEKYSYDGMNLIRKEITTNGKVMETDEYSYYENNVLKSKSITYDDKSRDECICYADENGNITEEIWTFADGSEGRNTFSYENGLLTEEVHENTEENIPYECITYIYDENGNISEKTSSARHSTNERKIYEYSENGNIIRITTKGLLKNNYVSEYAYDDFGNIISVTNIYSSGFEEKETFKYDEFGNCILRNLIQGDETVETEKKTYDGRSGTVISAEINSTIDYGNNYTYKAKLDSKGRTKSYEYVYFGYYPVKYECSEFYYFKTE